MTKIGEYQAVLVIDTALPETVVLFIAQGQVLATATSAEARRADNLLVLIDQVLTQAARSLSNVDLIVVRRGLGSYTGLRVGVTTANTLAWSLGVPIAGIELTAQRPVEVTDLMEQSILASHMAVVPKYGSWHDGRDSAKILQK